MPDPSAPSMNVGGILQSMPLDYMFSAPLNAVIKAQEQACLTFAGFLERVGLNKDGSVRTLRFAYEQAQMNAQGEATGGTLKRSIDMPFIAAIPLPNFSIDKLVEDFEMSIDTSEAQSSSTEAKGEFSAKFGFAFWSASVSGSVSHKSEQTRKTDTRSKLTIHMEASRMGPPEGLQRVLDFLMDAQIKPLPADKAPKLAAAPAQ